MEKVGAEAGDVRSSINMRGLFILSAGTNMQDQVGPRLQQLYKFLAC